MQLYLFPILKCFSGHSCNMLRSQIEALTQIVLRADLTEGILNSDIIKAYRHTADRRLNRERRGEVCNTDQLHIFLHGDTVCRPLTNRAVSGNAYSSVEVTIAKAKVTVTAEDKSSRVGYPLETLTYKCDPEEPFDGDGFTGELACSADKDTTGNYDITQGTLSLGENYEIEFFKGTYTVEEKLVNSNFKFDPNKKTVTYGEKDFIHAAIDAAEGSTVTYASKDKTVAVVDSTGKVHILKAGTTTITASSSETADYTEAHATYELTVNPKTLTSADLEYVSGAITKVYDGTTAAPGITVAVKKDSLAGDDELSITGSAAYNSANVSEANVIIFTPDAITDGNCRLAAAETLTITVASITQATPAYTRPEGLTAAYGQTLKDVSLESHPGWSWMDETQSVGDASPDKKTFQARFTPEDTANYKTLENIGVKLLVNKAAGKNLYTVDRSQKYADTQEYTFEADWTGLPEGQSWTYSVSADPAAAVTSALTSDGAKLTYQITGVDAGSTVTITLKTSCNNYEDCTITILVKIEKAASTGEPKYTRIGRRNATLEDANLTTEGSTLFPNEGTLEWIDENGNVLPADTKVEANKRYTWRFTPDDTNYDVLTGEVVLYRVSSGGGSSSGVNNTVKKNPDTEEAREFVDVPSGSYFEDAVNWAVENGITNGTGETTFSPDANCTRAQIVTFLWRCKSKK